MICQKGSGGLSVGSGDADHLRVCESSDLKADIAVMMNITPDHLDRYDHKMENYVNAKFRILQNQTHDDYFIYWQDDPVVKEQILFPTERECSCP